MMIVAFFYFLAFYALNIFKLKLLSSFFSLCLIITNASMSTTERTRAQRKGFKMSDFKTLILGFPWWLSGKESTCQCRKLFRSLVQEVPTHLGATKPVHHDY